MENPCNRDNSQESEIFEPLSFSLWPCSQQSLSKLLKGGLFRGLCREAIKGSLIKGDTRSLDYNIYVTYIYIYVCVCVGIPALSFTVAVRASCAMLMYTASPGTVLFLSFANVFACQISARGIKNAEPTRDQC